MDWINSPILPALGTALLHSLWQFCLLIGLAYFFAKQSCNPSLRHNIYLFALIACPIVFGLGFGHALSQELATSLAINEINFTNDEVTNEVAMLNEAPIQFWFEKHFLSIMGVLYLIGLMLLGLRSVYDLGRIQYLRRYSIPPTGALAEIYQQLQQQLPELKTYPLRLSAKVSSALTVGIVRPFILLPVSLVNALDPQEVEAILLHEMAHLFRRDHLWNALQNLIIQLFFYHPLVHWLHLQLGREREYACDDLVASRINRKVYAQSLLKVARLSITHKNQFVMQAQGKSNFSQRVQRLFIPEAKPTTRRWWLLPALLLPCMFALVLSAQQSPSAEQETLTEVPASTSPFGEAGKTIYFFNGRRYGSLEAFKDSLVSDTYTSICGISDPELQRINAAENEQYEKVIRFFTSGVPLSAADNRNGEPLAFDILDLAPEAEADQSIVAAQEKETPKPVIALEMDDIPVTTDSDMNFQQGAKITYYEQEEIETARRSAKDDVVYDGLLSVSTVGDSVIPSNPARSIHASNDSLLILVNGEVYEQKQMEAIDPNDIATINVRKGVAMPPEYQDHYIGMLDITLKKGVRLRGAVTIDAATGAEDTAIGSEEREATSIAPKLNIPENILILIDGEATARTEFQKLDPDDIETVSVIKDRKELKKLGYELYEGIIKVTTKKD